MAARNHQPSPPAYDHAVTALPTRAELLTMSAAQLEHQERIERLEHDRRVRALEIARLEAQHNTAAQPSKTSVGPDSKPSSSTHQSSQPIWMPPNSSSIDPHNLDHNDVSAPQPLPLAEAQRRMADIVAQGWTTNPAAKLSRPAKKISKLLRAILYADYASGPKMMYDWCWSWNEQNCIVLYTPRYETDRQKRIRSKATQALQDAAAELGVEFVTVKFLMQQYRPHARRENSYDLIDDHIKKGHMQLAAVKFCRDAFRVVPIVAKNCGVVGGDCRKGSNLQLLSPCAKGVS